MEFGYVSRRCCFVDPSVGLVLFCCVCRGNGMVRHGGVTAKPREVTRCKGNVEFGRARAWRGYLSCGKGAVGSGVARATWGSAPLRCDVAWFCDSEVRRCPAIAMSGSEVRWQGAEACSPGNVSPRSALVQFRNAGRGQCDAKLGAALAVLGVVGRRCTDVPRTEAREKRSALTQGR